MEAWEDSYGDQCGYDEPAIKAEEYWYYSTVRDAGELIRTHGADSFLKDLDERARNDLLKEIKEK